ncbi:MAG: 1-deoxy-D-xylulose-5-phosphate reductoisomerase, partial [Chthoniobacterales bacterium]
MSHSDMRFPIQYAFTWPDRVAGSLPPLEFAKLRSLDFEEPRYDVFPSLDLARQAAERGGAMPAVLNAANEVAVAEFLAARIAFPRIWETVAEVLEQTPDLPLTDLDGLLEADRKARELARAVALR